MRSARLVPATRPLAGWSGILSIMYAPWATASAETNGRENCVNTVRPARISWTGRRGGAAVCCSGSQRVTACCALFTAAMRCAQYTLPKTHRPPPRARCTTSITPAKAAENLSEHVASTHSHKSSASAGWLTPFYGNLMVNYGALVHGCVVECRICNREVAGSNLSVGYFAPRSTQPSIPPGSVNEYQLLLGRQRQVWLIPIADERVGVQVKL